MELRDPSAAPVGASQDSEIQPEATEPQAVTTGNTNTEAAPAGETEAEETPAEAEATGKTPLYADKAAVLAAVKEMAERDAAEIPNDEVARLKYIFYNFHNQESREAREAFIEAGDAPEAYVPEPDPDEAEFKAAMAIVKEKKAKAREELEAARAENLRRKKEIISEIQSMGEDTDNVNRHFQRMKELQTAFKEIGEVPPTDQAAVWKEYQDSVERYYDQLKINKELRDYDFRKNLSDKQLLLEEAQRLAETCSDDVVAAFHRLQALHDKWREIGPVAKDLREEIWAKFKDASAVVSKAYQAFFEERKQRERLNEEGKTALCERVEALDYSGLRTYAAWDEMTKTIMGAQEEWKQFGYASRKANNALFSRFRAVCDKFFAAKAEFFKSMKEELNANLEHKTALCEKAEALKESTDWRAATDTFLELQKEWKTIGAVPKKQSDAVWRRFIDACDYFFDRKKKANSGTRKTEQENLKAKQALIQRIKEIDPDTPRDEVVAIVRQARADWKEIGHVPFRDKETIYKEFTDAIDAQFANRNLSDRRARINNFESKVKKMEGNSGGLNRERERLVRVYEQRKADLTTYENNLGFLSSKSKSGDSLVREMERRVESLREEIEDLRKKIEVIDNAGA